MGGGSVKSHGQNRSEYDALKARMDQADQERQQDRISKKTDEWLLNQANLWKDATHDTEQALWLADKYWDEVFKAKSKPSAFEEILKALVVTLIPIAAEFAIFAGVIKIATMGQRARVDALVEVVDKISAKKVQKLARAKEALEHAQEGLRGRTETLETLKEVGTHPSVESYKASLEAGENAVAQVNGAVQGQAKLKFIEDTLEECRKARYYIEELRHQLAGAVDDVTPAEASAQHDFVVQKWTSLVGLAQPYKPGQEGTLKQMGLILLYDMLRSYCKKNVTLYRYQTTGDVRGRVPVSTAGARAMAQNARAELNKPRYDKGYLVYVSYREKHQAEKEALTDIEFEGLEPAQRGKMYDYVGQITNLGVGRPGFKDWVELIQAWDFASD